LELQRRKLDFRREMPVTLRYDELVIPRAYVVDFTVEGSIVVEIKSLPMIG